jgi:hypothetical protein
MHKGKIMKKLSIFVLTVVILGGLMPFQASAAPSLVTSRAALGGNDFIDWGDLGPPVPIPNPLCPADYVPSPFNITSNSCELPATVDNLSPLCPFWQRFRRVDEGSVLGTGWRGNFMLGDALLFTTVPSIGPVSITFDRPVSGAGAQVQPAAYCKFRATIKAFDVDNNQIASFTVYGTSTPAQNNTAIFLGVLDSTPTIKRIEFSVEQKVLLWYVCWPFAINQLDLVIPPFVDAGPDQEICSGSAQLAGQASCYGCVLWTGGSGTFSPNAATLNATYTPDPSELGSTVTLTLKACPLGPYAPQPTGDQCCDCTLPTEDQVDLTFFIPLECKITLDPAAATGTVLAGSPHTASVPVPAYLPATYEWIVTDEITNLITSTPPYGNAIEWVAPDVAVSIRINVKVTDANGCVCVYDPPLESIDTGIKINVMLRVPTLSEWGLIVFALLLAGLAISYRRKRHTT